MSAFNPSWNPWNNVFNDGILPNDWKLDPELWNALIEGGKIVHPKRNEKRESSMGIHSSQKIDSNRSETQSNVDIDPQIRGLIDFIVLFPSENKSKLERFWNDLFESKEKLVQNEGRSLRSDTSDSKVKYGSDSTGWTHEWTECCFAMDFDFDFGNHSIKFRYIPAQSSLKNSTHFRECHQCIQENKDPRYWLMEHTNP